jgi:hypothetical protein
MEEGIARAQELAGEGEMSVGAGEVGGQALSLGLIDHVAIDIVPVVFGPRKPYFGTLANGHLMLEDPEVLFQGDGVLHLRYPVHRRRQASKRGRPSASHSARYSSKVRVRPERALLPERALAPVRAGGRFRCDQPVTSSPAGDAAALADSCAAARASKFPSMLLWAKRSRSGPFTPGTWMRSLRWSSVTTGSSAGAGASSSTPTARGGATPDYRLTCIFIDRDYRCQGTYALALQGALDPIAKAGDGVVEGYPQDTSDGRRVGNSFLYNGTRSLYERAGFTYQRPKGKNHTVMRRTVAAA